MDAVITYAALKLELNAQNDHETAMARVLRDRMAALAPQAIEMLAEQGNATIRFGKVAYKVGLRSNDTIFVTPTF